MQQAELVLRFGIALLIGVLIGLEREYTRWLWHPDRSVTRNVVASATAADRDGQAGIHQPLEVIQRGALRHLKLLLVLAVGDTVMGPEVLNSANLTFIQAQAYQIG
jgi:hypothetical protein